MIFEVMFVKGLDVVGRRVNHVSIRAILRFSIVTCADAKPCLRVHPRRVSSLNTAEPMIESKLAMAQRYSGK